MLWIAAFLAWGLQDQDPEAEKTRAKLRAMSLDELLEVRITTVSRREEPLGLVPAAVSVLSGEDLRRMGSRSLPEALRYLPGVQVLQTDGSTWGVSIRGQNGRFANKLQVLVDGRSAYTPLFSGVFWEQTDTMLEDVERIEVVRGPGASVWGANAVHGVINVITKKAADTHGGLLSAGMGTEELDFAALRWGGSLGDDVDYRAFVKEFNRDENFEGHDDWSQVRAGARMEWRPTRKDEVGWSGEYYDAEAHHERTAAYLTPPNSRTWVDREDFSGGFITAWWTRDMGGAGDLRFQTSYEYANRQRETSGQVSNILEVDLIHSFKLLDFNQVTWGLGYRGYWDDIHNTFQLSYDPDKDHRYAASLFVQDEAELVKDLLWFTLGTKLEYNDSTGLEPQPTLRLGLKPAEGHYLWASASRAVRTPSRADEDHTVNVAVFGPTVVSVTGNSDIREEEMTAYEAGYRLKLGARMTVDLAVFYNVYEDLIQSVPAGVFVSTTDNVIEGTARGAEVEVVVDVLKDWRLRAAYSYLDPHYEEQGDADASARATAEGLENVEVRHRASIWSFMSLPWDFEVDVGYRFVDRTITPKMSSWAEMDARIGWRGVKGLEVGVAGRNLLHDHHQETAAATSGGVTVLDIDRAVFGYLTWRF